MKSGETMVGFKLAVRFSGPQQYFLYLKMYVQNPTS